MALEMRKREGRSMAYGNRRQATALAGALALAAASISAQAASAQAAPSADDAKAIAAEATIYALPMVMNYAIMYQYAVDKNSSQYKAPFNEIFNEATVFTPADTAIVTPNSDTPYSFLWMDLRAEPMVLCMPEIKDRYYSVQLLSLYTFNFGYIGSRATGMEAGCYGVAGPNWSGETPEGVEKIYQSGTDFAVALYRTQLVNAADIDNVRAVQAKYSAEPLSSFLKQPAPPAPPAVDWMEIDKDKAAKDRLDYLAFLLQFAPPVGPAEVEVLMRKKFASIGIEAGKPFPSIELTDELKAAISEGEKAGMEKAKERQADLGKSVNGWQMTEAGTFGSREMLKGDYLLRAAAALAGIYGNDAEEALYASTRLDGSKAGYTLTFPADGLPPVNAFWSLTIYNGETQLLVDNPIDRYLINSPMLPDMQKNDDGSLTLYIQKDEPADPKQKANWLPAPDGPIYLVMRLYWPKKEALEGDWQPPAIEAAKG